jgi:hypothetical protein
MGTGGSPFVIRRARGGIGVLTNVFIVMLFVGISPMELLQQKGGVNAAEPQTTPKDEIGTETERRDFVATVLADMEDVWYSLLARQNLKYTAPKLVLYTGSYQTACGAWRAERGPSYCIADRSIYLDLDFFRDFEFRNHARGYFARAYVVAHEVGHHVQNLLGVLQTPGGLAFNSTAERNAFSRELELQADCFAGVWANHALAKGLLEEDDILAMTATAALVSDNWFGIVDGDHGTATQRVRWFRTGVEGGRVDSCDTSQAIESRGFWTAP